MMVESELEEKSSSSVTDISLQVNYFFSSIKPCVKINIETSGRVMFLNLSKMVRKKWKDKGTVPQSFQYWLFCSQYQIKIFGIFTGFRVSGGADLPCVKMRPF